MYYLSSLSIYSTLIAVVLSDYNAAILFWFSFILWWAVDIQIWALLTRSQCKVSDTQVTVKACGPLVHHRILIQNRSAWKSLCFRWDASLKHFLCESFVFLRIKIVNFQQGQVDLRSGIHTELICDLMDFPCVIACS